MGNEIKNIDIPANESKEIKKNMKECVVNDMKMTNIIHKFS